MVYQWTKEDERVLITYIRTLNDFELNEHKKRLGKLIKNKSLNAEWNYKRVKLKKVRKKTWTESQAKDIPFWP